MFCATGRRWCLPSCLVSVWVLVDFGCLLLVSLCWLIMVVTGFVVWCLLPACGFGALLLVVLG